MSRECGTNDIDAHCSSPEKYASCSLEYGPQCQIRMEKAFEWDNICDMWNSFIKQMGFHSLYSKFGIWDMKWLKLLSPKSRKWYFSLGTLQVRATAYKNGRLKLWSEKRGANPCHPGPPTGSRHEKGTVVITVFWIFIQLSVFSLSARSIAAGRGWWGENLVAFNWLEYLWVAGMLEMT